VEVIGKITSAAPTKAMYEVGDEVWVNLRSYVIYRPNHDWSGWWNTYYQVTSVTGKVLGSAVFNHTIAPWTTEDRADEELSIKCGRFSNSDILTVKMEFEATFLPWSMRELLDDRKVQVWVRELAVPEPPVSRTPIIPIPVPTPGPAPGPTPLVPVPDNGAPPVDGGLPWGWIGAAALGLVILAPKPKARKG